MENESFVLSEVVIYKGVKDAHELLLGDMYCCQLG